MAAPPAMVGTAARHGVPAADSRSSDSGRAVATTGRPRSRWRRGGFAGWAGRAGWAGFARWAGRGGVADTFVAAPAGRGRAIRPPGPRHRTVSWPEPDLLPATAAKPRSGRTRQQKR
ncbi:hypothetical protein BL254_15530 [Protofrankia sp. BMG5.30]|uniref:Uncharacterized protein n=1 Tax=Protofrankia coriariae TaxID=1562887 RepID=A0ABR5F0D5_9ACTN|nr:hypothetical protein FrCorBMG51_19570 [Protofrankia coriariae]ONH34635.1 hypothetical protein BL254_15530 [Protofrankia sp. BMG5.30]